MNLFSDQLVLWVINVLIHSTVLTAVLLCVAMLFRKRAAMRYWILCCGLLLVLASPAVSALVQSRGSGWLALALPNEPAPTASVAVTEQQTPSNDAPIQSLPTPQDDPSITPSVPEITRMEEIATASVVSKPMMAADVPANPSAAMPAVKNARSPMQWLAIIVTIATVVWAMGAMLLLMRMTIGWSRLAGILRRSEPVTDPDYVSAFMKACALAGCHEERTPRLVASDEISGPLAAGIFAGSVVLPKRLIVESSPAELAEVLVHEVAHVVRRDQIVVLIQNLVAAIYWPHPLVRKLNRELAKAREEVCDNFVLRATDAPIYSRTLLSLAQLVQRPETIPGSVGFFASRWRLEQRVAGLLDESRDTQTILSRRGWAFVLASTVGLLAAICVGTVTIATAQNKADETTAESESESSEIEISGIVREQSGGPIGGAKIWLAVTSFEGNSERNTENRKGLLRELGSTDERGRFDFLIDEATTLRIRERPRFAQVQIFATSDGHGMDWLPLDVFQDDPIPSRERDRLQSRIDDAFGDGRFASRTLVMRPESQPVRGRLVDLEGNRLSNVTVLVESLCQPNVPQLMNALENAWKQGVYGAMNSTGVAGGLARSELQKFFPPTKTDENGEFEIRGIGDDQLVTLVFQDERIEARPVHVVGREMETVSLPYRDQKPDGTKDLFVGRDFNYSAAPSIPVEGTVTDYDTGEPLTGVLVSVEGLFRREYAKLRLDTRHMRAVTDQRGRFRIIGMPPGEGHIIEAVPPKSEPYLPAPHEVSLSLEGGKTKRIKIQVKRGVWIEGLITDKESGEPRSAAIEYMAMVENPYAMDVAGWDPKLMLSPVQIHQRYVTDSDGRYRLPGLPGPGVLLVRSLDPGYPLAAGAETIDGYDPSTGKIPTTPFPVPASDWHLLQQINPAKDAVSLTSDLMLDGGVRIPGRVVGPDGEPVSDLYALGLTEGDPYWTPNSPDKVLLTDRFTVNGYNGKGPRQLFFKNQDETLAGQYRLEGTAPPEIAVKLEPPVRVIGRLIENETGLPAARYFVSCEECLLNGNAPPLDFMIRWCDSDNEGDFEIKGLISGHVYKMKARNRVNKKVYFTIDLTDTKPGDVIDLGEIGRTSSKRDRAADALPRVQGRVLDPSGKPIAATLWFGGPAQSGGWSPSRTSVTWTQVGKSGADGQFQMSLPKPENRSVTSETLTFRIAATAEGLGFAWANVTPGKLTDNVTLQLVNDTPIRGRIVTLDGTPAANVRLDVVSVFAPDSLPESAELIKNAQLSSGVYTNWPSWSGGSPLTKSVVTDNDGRFQLSGLGSERRVRLQALGDGLAATRLSIVTREKPSDSAGGVIAVRSGLSESSYFAEFTHVAVPGRIVRGTVVDQTSGQPLPDVRIMEPTSWASRAQPAVTDAEGRFVIQNVPKATQYRLQMSPDNATHFRSELNVPDATGSEALDVDLILTPGIRLRGRVLDEVTGEGVQAEIIYNALFPNDAIELLGVERVANPLSKVQTEADGRFEIAVLPGPGAISAEVSGEEYATVLLKEKDLREIFPDGDLKARPDAMGQFNYLPTANGGQSRGIMGLSRVQAVMLLNPSRDDPGKEVKLLLRRGLKVQGELFDPRGKPVLGVTVFGLGPSPVSITDEPLETNRFSVTGLLPGSERTLLFLNLKRSLGAIVNVKGDEKDTVKVELKPTGSVSGSLVNLDGDPITNGYVSMRPQRNRLRSQLWEATTDEEGRFQIGNLPAGVAFSLHVRTDAQRMAMFVHGNIRAEANAKSELGEFRQKDKLRFESVAMEGKLGEKELQP